MVHKNFFILILLANSCLLAMEQELNVQIPGSHKRSESAKKVLDIAGYAGSDVHLKALLYAFEKMERTPGLVRVHATDPDVFCEEGGATQSGLTRFDHIKQCWNSYYCSKKLSKTKKGKGVDSISGETLTGNAQDLSKLALEYFLDSKELELASQTKQKYIIAVLGMVATILGPVITKYLVSGCSQSE